MALKTGTTRLDAGTARVAADEAAAPGPSTTMIEAFHRTVAQRAEETAIRGPRYDLSWTELRDRAENLAKGLAGLGVGNGDSVAILLVNRPEFHVTDIAAMLLGAVPFSIYQTLPVEQIKYVLTDSAARVVVTEQRYLDVVRQAVETVPSVSQIIVVDGESDDHLTLADVERGGKTSNFDLVAATAAVDSESPLTLIYTSGTTGPSKGVELLHRNALAAVEATRSRIPFPYDSRVISWLPAAHIAERIAHHYLPMAFGIQITSCDDMKQIGRYLTEVEPTWFFGVPRIWEKLKAGLEAVIAGLDDDRARTIEAAIDAGKQKVRLEQAGAPVPSELVATVAQADTDIFVGFRAKLGFARLAVANVGSAPVPADVIEFFHAIGVPLSEIYGMSETCGVGCSNPLERIKIGTVGLPAEGVEMKIGADGEVLIRSDAVMRRYRNMPEKTAEVLQDGWYHTGDIGVIDDEGYVSIVDRKKEIIINSAGKNMSPAMIESTLKSASPLIGQACVVGDARPYNTALIVLDPDVASTWAARHSIADTDLVSLALDETVRMELRARIDEANAQLSRPEQIKKFYVVPGDWVPAGDELTPTSKLKRRSILEKYSAEISALY